MQFLKTTMASFLLCGLSLLFNMYFGMKVFITQSYNNPDSLYVLKMIWDHRHNNVRMGDNFSFIDGNHIHWANLYPYLLDNTGKLVQAIIGNEITSLCIASNIILFVSMFVFTYLFIVFLKKTNGWMVSIMLPAIALTASNYFNYGMIVSITHHNLMLDWAGIALLLALLNKPVLSAISIMFSIWISPEIMPFSMIIFSILQIQDSRKAIRFIITEIIAGLFICYIDPPDSNLDMFFLPDRITFGYVLLFIIEFILFFLLVSLKKNKFVFNNISIIVSITLWYLIPGIHSGFDNMIPQDIKHNWYINVQEIAPLNLHHLTSIVWIYNYWVMCILSLILIRDKKGFVLACSALVYGLLSLLHNRTNVEFSMISIVAFSYVISIMKEKIIPLLILASSTLIYVLYVFLNIENNAIFQPEYLNTKCDIRGVSHYLEKVYPGARVLTDIDDAPYLVWFTRGSNIKTFTGPYHRNVKSMREAFSIYQADPQNAYKMLKELNINIILKCGNAPDAYNYGNSNSFWNTLLKTPVDGIHPVLKMFSGYRLYEVAN